MEHVLPDDRRVATVLRLLALGYADRMVLSHDAAVYSHVTPPSWRARKAPSWHMVNISQRILPMLRDGRRHGDRPGADARRRTHAACSSRRGEGGAARRARPDRRRAIVADRRRRAEGEVRIAVGRGRPVRVRPQRLPRDVGRPRRYPWIHGPRGLRHDRGGRPGGADARGSARSSSSSRTSSAARAPVSPGPDVSVRGPPVGRA